MTILYINIKTNEVLNQNEMLNEWKTKYDPEGKKPYGWRWQYVPYGVQK